ncbi:MAG: hypothetical protein V3V20_05420 [Algisphaera sp.]
MARSSSPFTAATPRGSRDPHATPAALGALIDRARDERFRLLSLLKDARSQVAVTGPAADSAPVPAINTRLIAAVNRLNEELCTRVEELESVETRLSARLDVIHVETVMRAETEAQRRVDVIVRAAEQRMASLATGIARQFEDVSANTTASIGGPRLATEEAA